MALTFDADQRSQIVATVSGVPTTIDHTTATLTLEIDDVRYPCTWTAAAVVTGATWTRTAKTTAWFAGPSVPTADIAGATVLTYGLHQPKLIVSDGTAIIPNTMPLFVISR